MLFPAPVSRLLRSCSPPAIAGRVAAIIVDAVDTAISRSLAHVEQKVFKLVPALADCNSTSAIVPIGVVVFIAAPSMHAHPRIVSATIASTAFRRGVTVFRVVTFQKEATARSCVSTSQVPVRDNQLGAARAPAKPIDFSVVSMRDVDRGQTLKALACDVRDWFGQGGLLQGLLCQVTAEPCKVQPLRLSTVTQTGG